MNDNKEQDPVVLRQINTKPKKRWRNHWKNNMLYPLYSVVENNGTVFISLTGKMKGEPYVIYDKSTDTFSANEGWEIVEMSADSRITAMGGSAGGSGYVKPENGIPIRDLSPAVQSALAKAEASYEKPEDGIPIDDLESSLQVTIREGGSAYKKPSTGIPKTDMESSVQASLDKADSAYQKASGGIPLSDLTPQVQEAIGNGDAAYQKPASGIPASDIAAGVIPDISGKQDTISDLSTIRSGAAAGATAYQKPASGIPASDIASGVIPAISTDVSSDAASDVKTSSPKSVKTYVDAGIAAVNADLSDLEDVVGAIDIGAYVMAWDGNSEPVVANIPAGVSVTYNTTTYTGTLAASASTIQKIYLVATGTTDNYDRYITVGDSTYSWVNLGTTEITLADYAPKTEVSQLEAKVDGKPVHLTGAVGAYKTRYPIINGNKYRVTNNGSVTISFYTCDASGTRVPGLYRYLAAGVTEELTATADADYVGGYSSAALDFSIVSPGSIVEDLSSTDDVAVTARYEADGFPLSITSEGAATYFKRYPIQAGRKYRLTNNGESTVSVKTCNKSRADVTGINANVNAGQTKIETASANAYGLTGFSGSAINLEVIAIDSLTEQTEELKAEIVSQNDKIDGRPLHIATESASGYTNEYPIRQGKQYQLINNGSANISSHTVDAEATTIPGFNVTVNAGTTITVTASDDAWGIQGYCGGAIDFTIRAVGSLAEDIEELTEDLQNLSDDISGLNDDITDINTEIDGHPVTITTAGAASYRQKYPIKDGKTYKVTNAGESTASFYTVDESGNKIAGIDRSLNAGVTEYLVSSADAYGVGGFSGSAVNISILTVDSLKDPADILLLNPRSELDAKIIQSHKRYSIGYTIDQTVPPIISLLHFSDIHSDKTNTERIKEVWERYADYIDDCLNTGDTLSVNINSDFAFWTEVGMDKALIAIGNHDAWTNGDDPDKDYQESGGDNLWVVKQSVDYQKFIAPFVALWGVTQPQDAAQDGKCYYIKDYVNSYNNTTVLRLVVMDAMHFYRGADLVGGVSTQGTWLSAVLDDARQNGIPVAIVSHYRPGRLDYIDCAFTNSDAPENQGDLLNEAARDAVHAFMVAGGEFIGWVCGHSHYDAIGTLTAYSDQFVVIIDCAATITTSDDARVMYTKTQDCMNIISFDVRDKLIKVVRIGNDYNRNLEHKGLFVYRYKDVDSSHLQGLIRCI